MRTATFRRLVALVLALTLTVGLAVHHGAAADMGADMASMVAGDMPGGGMCDGCGTGNEGMSLGACSADCTTSAALLSGAAVADALSPLTVTHPAMPMGVGWSVPPDPYPPRSTIPS